MYEDEPTPAEALNTAQRLVADALASLDDAVRARDLDGARLCAIDMLERSAPFRTVAVPLGIAALVREARAAATRPSKRDYLPPLVRAYQRMILEHYRDMQREERQRDLSALYSHLGLE